MFPRSARLYDLIYSFKDYAHEAHYVHMLIRQYKLAPGMALLDVGCGTGKHLAFLRHYKYTGAGLDLDAGLLAVARRRYPAIPFYEGDMVDFDLGQSFDVITCLFSAMGYVRTVERLRQ